MDQRGKKRESEHDLRVKVESSNPIDLASSPSTHSAGPQEQPSSNGFVDVKPEEHTFDEVEPRSAQPCSDNDIGIDNWTAEELFKRHETSQQAFMEDYRNAASQERSQLAQTLHREVQTGIDHIVGYISGFVARSTQPSTSVDIETLKTKFEKEREHAKDLQNNYNMAIDTIKRHRREIQKANTKLQDTLQERDQLRQLVDGGSLANSSKATDDTIKGKWTEIDYNIRCMVHVLNNAPSAESLDDEVTQRLRFISGEYHSMLQDPDLREFLMRGYVWAFIQDNVFDSGECTWGGPDLKSYKSTRDSLIGRMGAVEKHSNDKSSIAYIAKWLAQGAAMMNQLWEKDSTAIKRMVHDEAKRLRPFASNHRFRLDRVDKKISDQLSDIIGSAIELDQMMMRSKAVFMIHWRDRSQEMGPLERWNPEVMEAEAYEQDLSEKSRVKLRLSPTLYKVGTADGQNYDSRMVLAKSAVVCD
ncbi:uncharacterized protein FIESC28_03589 [Fusarium coffeatum]|uniref:Uncharacterized protein n=1 Tax=Fusarium coffeatum TaxID=231269 RepID=A0A366S4R1_9HYPO|nr:uncharacterized protein FIESC28_03589 [Fusarium coffeatum]RBR23660.1 hypothetical protein FIESC28_03589 [Fusarium coffeatum]